MSLLKPKPMVLSVTDEVMAAMWNPLSTVHRKQIIVKALIGKGRDVKRLSTMYSLLPWERLVEHQPFWATEIRKAITIVIS